MFDRAHPCAEERNRIHYISIPVILFVPVSHIIHLWKIGKEWSMKGPWVRWKLTRQLERTEKRPEDSYWWISVKTDAKGYEFDNRAKHRGTAVNDLGSGAEQKWLVSRGCKDSKDLPRSTHRNRLCHPFELTVLSGVKSQLQQRCALATNTTIKSNKNDQRLNHRTNKTKRIRVIYTCKEESQRTQESLEGFCKDKKKKKSVFHVLWWTEDTVIPVMSLLCWHRQVQPCFETGWTRRPLHLPHLLPNNFMKHLHTFPIRDCFPKQQLKTTAVPLTRWV